ncbi:MAG: hypothetical protein NT023_13915 [Armatimonadetes bacterium]|nr:hypothetical protein [Armatimonadota bacterium]
MDDPVRPHSFVAMMACDCGATDAMAVGFGVAMHTGPSTPDRAFVGWEVEIPEFTNVPGDISLIDWTTEFYKNLNAGKTVLKAIDDANISPGKIWNQARTIQLSPVKFGDPATKVHGVYGGNLLAWYR